MNPREAMEAVINLAESRPVHQDIDKAAAAFRTVLDDQASLKLICLPEGDLDGVYEFPTTEEREAFHSGYASGAGQYGCGNLYLIDWEELSDPEAFEQDHRGEFSSLVYTLDELRKRVEWVEK